MKNSAWRVRRAALGLRQRDVAERVGTSQSRYSLLERGEVIPTAVETDAINGALELPNDMREDLLRISSSLCHTKA
jgi:transcriptional regulator with XRE-family HTH domain